VVVTLCTYNERENIERLIPEILRAAPWVDVLVIDDSSPDGTGAIVAALGAGDPRVRLLTRPGKLGLGTATLAGLRTALDAGYDIWVNMDADFSHDPHDVPRLIDALDHCDVAIGSRYIPGGDVRGWGLTRSVMSRGVNLCARWLLGLKTRDSSGAFRSYRLDRLRQLDLARFRATGYAVQEELLYRCGRVGCSVRELPIVFVDRRRGTSKISVREIVLALWVMILLAIDRLRQVPVTADMSRRPTPPAKPPALPRDGERASQS
jgi:dolichol-phosphate mannosyltransferase